MNVMKAVRGSAILGAIGLGFFAPVVVPVTQFSPAIEVASSASAIGVGTVYNGTPNWHDVRRDADNQWFTVAPGTSTGGMDADAFRARTNCVQYRYTPNGGPRTSWRSISNGSTAYMVNDAYYELRKTC